MADWEKRFSNASRFWLSEDYYRPAVSSYSSGTTSNSYSSGGNAERVARMMQVHKACANFVKILTGRDDLKVRFSGDGQSYTNGKDVVISANTKEEDFDITVGLCLHEASHCVLTDFKVANDPNVRAQPDLFKILNWVEDRRIDAYVYKNAPGYRDYYEALYERYFRSPLVDKALKSKHFRTEDFKSYDCRITNIMNENTDLKALKHLQKISDLIDLPNIDRLKTTGEALQLSKKIYELIQSAIADQAKQDAAEAKQKAEADNKNKQDGDTQSDSNDGAPSDDSDSDSDSKDDKKSNSNDKGDNKKSDSGNSKDEDDDKDKPKSDSKSSPNGKNEGNDGEDSDDDSDSSSTGDDVTKEDTSTPGQTGKANDSLPELSDRQMDLVEKALAQQTKFIAGNVEKKNINQHDVNALKDLSNIAADVEFIKDAYGNPVPCYMYKLSDAVLTGNDPHGLFIHTQHTKGKSFPKEADMYKDSIQEGLSLGAVLGGKLKMHDENRELITSHREHGKIDKRLIASLGMGLERVFYDKHTDRHVPKCIYVTLDGSGSMSHVDSYSIPTGTSYDDYKKYSRFYKSQVAVVALIKACTMIQSIRIIVDYRYSSAGNAAVALRVFDSKTDKISKVINQFKYLRTMGGTPEGYAMTLPFKKGDIAKGSQNLKSYFINFSDGEPSFSGANDCTKKLVDDIRKQNTKVMSFFIGDAKEQPSHSFTHMYGKKDSHAINVSQLLPLAKSLNKMFMES